MYAAMVPHRERVTEPLCWRPLIAFAAALVMAACGSDRGVPTAPTPNSASVASVAVRRADDITHSVLAVSKTSVGAAGPDVPEFRRLLEVSPAALFR